MNPLLNLLLCFSLALLPLPAGAVSTDYTATESNTNSGFFIIDKTEVSLTQSADFTSITAGGEVEVSGAQVVAGLDQSSAAFGLNAKSLIGIDEAGSAQRLEVSGQGPANVPSSGGGGGSGDPAYDFAGSRVNIGLPTSLDDAGYAYLDDLNASGQLTVEEMALVQHQFYDQDIQLSPAFKAVLSIAIGNFVAPGLVGGILSSNAPLWAVKAAEAFASTLMVGGIEGVVSGDLNVGKILEGATFSALTAGLTAGININLPKNHPWNAALIPGFGTTQLTLSGLVNAGLDGVITSGLSSAVYGTDFGAGVVDAITRAVVMSVAGASIQEVSDLLGHDVASLEKTIAKATVNCLAAQANGASCASGALGTLVVDLGLGDALKLAELGPDEAERRMKIAALVVGFLTSEGKGENVDATLAAAQLDFDNNLLPIVAILAAVGGALTAADYALTANDAYNLAEAGLACDAGDTAACARATEMAKQFAIETGVTLTIGAFVPGDKIGMKIIAMMRKKGNDEILEALDKAEETYKGGPHKDTSQPVNDKKDSHHCPAKKCYENAPISSADGPAIQMDPADHTKTASYGNSTAAKEFRSKQQALLTQGKLEEAIQMDIDDIRSKFGSKYDDAINEMVEYARTLDPSAFSNE